MAPASSRARHVWSPAPRKVSGAQPRRSPLPAGQLDQRHDRRRSRWPAASRNTRACPPRSAALVTPACATGTVRLSTTSTSGCSTSVSGVRTSGTPWSGRELLRPCRVQVGACDRAPGPAGAPIFSAYALLMLPQPMTHPTCVGRPLMPVPGRVPGRPASAGWPRLPRTCPSHTRRAPRCPRPRAWLAAPMAWKSMTPEPTATWGDVLTSAGPSLMCSSRTDGPMRRDERGGVDPADLRPVDVDLREHGRPDDIEQVLEPGAAVDHRGKLELVVVIPDGDAPRGRVLLRQQQVLREGPDRGQVGEALRWRPRHDERVHAQRREPVQDLVLRHRRWAAADAPTRPPGPGPPPSRAPSVGRCPAGWRTRRRRSPPARRVPARTGSPVRPPRAGSRAGARWGWGCSCCTIVPPSAWT